MLHKNRVTLMLAASTLMAGVAMAPMALAAESTSTETGEHMMKPHAGMMKPHAGMMKGHAMKGHAMKGDAMKSTPPAQ
jgi:pentapeptide MXKDX repeat protein